MTTALAIPAMVPTSAVVSAQTHTHTQLCEITADQQGVCVKLCRLKLTIVVIVLIDLIPVSVSRPPWKHTVTNSHTPAHTCLRNDIIKPSFTFSFVRFVGVVFANVDQVAVRET